MNDNILLHGEGLGVVVGNNQRVKRLLADVNIAVTQGRFTAIIGPNGAGKTTLLNLIDGDNVPTEGRVYWKDKPLADIDRLTLAQQRAVLPQVGNVPFAVKVIDIVALGREPYRYHSAQQYSAEIIDKCLQLMDISHLAEQNYTTLSGGEQHRVHLARTLAQIHTTPDDDLHGKILFLDEPTNHLDIHHQYRLMQLLKTLQKLGLTVIAVMHDLSLTLQYAEQIVLLQKGQKVGDFTPDGLVASDALSQVYQMQMNIRWDEEWARFMIAPKLQLCE